MISAAMVQGFADALQPINVLFVCLGVFIGYVVGVLPGLNRATALAVTVPLTFYLAPAAAIGFLIGISKGSATGGAVTAILINTPGEPSSVVTALDGFPLARQGKAGKALKMALVGSVFGDLLATFVLIALAAPLARIALGFGPIELAAVLLFALTFVAALSSGSLLKGLAAAAIGLLFACVGVDAEMSTQRLTFGFPELSEGIPLLAVAVGMMALGEMLDVLSERRAAQAPARYALADSGDGGRLSRTELRASLPTLFRSTAIGIGVGMIPGLGATVASFLSYGAAKRASKTPENFGRGEIDGVAASETADNAVVPAALVPLFAIGIPSTIPAAMLMTAFVIHGLAPGPLLFKQHGGLVGTIYGGMILASAAMFAIGWYGLRVFAALARLPDTVVVPVVVFLCVIGGYLEGSGYFSVYLMLLFAVIGYVMRRLDLSFVTFLIGFIVGPAFELAFRQSLIITGGEPSALLDHPIALGFIALALVAVVRFGLMRRPQLAAGGD